MYHLNDFYSGHKYKYKYACYTWVCSMSLGTSGEYKFTTLHTPDYLLGEW